MQSLGKINLRCLKGWTGELLKSYSYDFSKSDGEGRYPDTDAKTCTVAGGGKNMFV